MTTVDCVLKAKAEMGECPVWDTDAGKLWWIDITGQTLNRFDPVNRSNECWPVGTDIGSCALAGDGSVIMAMRGGFRRFDMRSEETTLLAAVEAETPAIRLNDGRCDGAGRYWAGTVHIPPDPDDPRGALFQLDPDGCCSRVLDNFLIPNGMAMSPDSRTLYISDSHPSVQTIWAFDFDLDAGELSRRRIFATTREMAGRPDGACVDAEGFYWIALIDGWQIARFAPDGRLDRTVQMPVSSPTMCCFGGDDLSTMYVTSIRPGRPDSREAELAGGIFAFDPGVRGLPEPRFGNVRPEGVA